MYIKSVIKIKLICNWTTSEQISSLWNRMKPSFSKIQLVNDKPDYYVVINHPLYLHEINNENNFSTPIIIFNMEPNYDIINNVHNNFHNPTLYVTHNYPTDSNTKHIITMHNNIEWHLSKSYSELCLHQPNKTKLLSAIISNRYIDPGHILRIDFIHYLKNSNIVEMDVFGNNSFEFNKGSLPLYNKDEGLFQYKYHFAAENNSIPNYFTEKIIDAILSESLCFYWGCPNLETWIDPKCFIRLELKDFKHDLEIIKNCIEHDEWSLRIEYIRKEKNKILNDYNFFTTIENIINESI